jgi:hypothetical protein
MFKYWIFFFTLILLISCANLKNPVAKDNFCYSTKLFNKNLGISTTYFGDMRFFDLNKKNINHINNIIEDAKILNNKMSIIAYSKTISDPNYESLLLYDKDSDIKLADGLIINDAEKKYVLFKKSNGNDCVYLLLKSFDVNILDMNPTLLVDGQKILNSITFNNSELEKISYLDIFNGIKELDNYLVSIDKLKKAPLEQTNKQQKFNKFQLLVTLNSFVSNNKEYDSLIVEREKSIKNNFQPRVDSLLLKKEKRYNENVLNEICSLIKNEQVIMLNENHWYPKHRILASKLLDKLKENGFKYLAIEAIESKKDSILNIRNYPSKETGYYTREPYFAHFIRKAKKLGFQIVQYDDMDGIIDRELSQATNLKKIIDKDPKAKIFVYAGIDHILESNPSKKRMAEYFKELTGINPLTFNQVKIIADIPTELEIFPSINFNGFNGLTTNVDYFIINNIKPSINDVYEEKEFGKLILELKKFKINKNESVLVKIYNENEHNKLKSNAIPISIFFHNTENKNINIDFPKGRYFIKISSLKQDSLFGDFINVN